MQLDYIGVTTPDTLLKKAGTIWIKFLLFILMHFTILIFMLILIIIIIIQVVIIVLYFT